MSWFSRTNWSATDRKPNYTDLNSWGLDLRTWGGNVDAAGYHLSVLGNLGLSGGKTISVIPSADGDALTSYPAALVSAGTQLGGRHILRANAYDTSNHTRDFVCRARTTSNAGLGLFELLTRIDGGS